MYKAEQFFPRKRSRPQAAPKLENKTQFYLYTGTAADYWSRLSALELL